MRLGFARRLTLTLALLLLGFGTLVALLGRHVAAQQDQETLQRLSSGLAGHIVAHWPEVRSQDGSDTAARAELLRMLMVVNPGVQVYPLDADGQVAAYIGPPGMVRTPQVDLAPVRAFLAGAALPLRGTDPMGGDEPRVFSAAMFPPQAGQTRPPGYLYVVLDSAARASAVAGTGNLAQWRGAAWVAAAGLLLTLLTGAAVLRWLSLPLNRLAQRMAALELGAPGPSGATPSRTAADEVGAMTQAFEAMRQRLAQQVHQRDEQAAAHREAMASVAHDLRTPLTALHGHLEALGDAGLGPAADRSQLLAVALAQSYKLRRLCQQLFELATLQASDQLLQRERFRLDELVTDTVQKFSLAPRHPPVALTGSAPGPIDLDGDLHLIERALTNLIDNAVRHAAGSAVRVSLRGDAHAVTVLVEDSGPGLPPELARRLDADQAVREPPLRRPGGGIGGLGLAIAQRIALLHGGSLHTLPTPQGGTRLALALPRTLPAG